MSKAETAGPVYKQKERKHSRKKTKTNKLRKPKCIFCKLWLENEAHVHSFVHRMEIPSYAGQSVLTDRLN